MIQRKRLFFALLVSSIFGMPVAWAVDTDGDGVADENDVCVNSKPGSIVDAVGRPYGDADGDCDVDLADFAVFVINMTGPIACIPSPEACNGIDDNCDGMIDETFDLLTDLDNCGTCGNACPSPAHATRSCNQGACDYDCVAGYVDCDGSAANGCEADTNEDPMNCGACGVVCPTYPNTVSTCENASCGYDCDGGYEDCNGSSADGCEANLDSSVDHCGECDYSCGDCLNGTSECLGFHMCGCDCDSGYENCDFYGGCEVDILNDPENCGFCGFSCGIGKNCVNGFCQ